MLTPRLDTSLSGPAEYIMSHELHACTALKQPDPINRLSTSYKIETGIGQRLVFSATHEEILDRLFISNKPLHNIKRGD